MSIERIKAELATIDRVCPASAQAIKHLLESGAFPKVAQLLKEDALAAQNKAAAESTLNTHSMLREGTENVD